MRSGERSKSLLSLCFDVGSLLLILMDGDYFHLSFRSELVLLGA